MVKRHSRALRRHHLARLKRKRRNYHGGYINALPMQARAKHRGKLAHTAKQCSCPLCGNPRIHWREATRQEKIADKCDAFLCFLYTPGTRFYSFYTDRPLALPD